MAKVIEAPADDYPLSVFLGGGITGCGDWQSDIAKLLDDLDLILFNPRREAFDLANKANTVAQIHWEYRYLRIADCVLFWYPNSSICPITLYETGAMTREAGKPVFVGCDPAYPRREDLEIQVPLIRPEIQIVYSIDDLAKQVRLWYQLAKVK